MSADGHEAPDDSRTNRAWLSSVLVFCAIVPAAAAGLLNAAPHARKATAAGPTGVIVLDDGTVRRGTVLVRGSTLAVIHGQAGERVIPRQRVRYFRTEASVLGEDYWAAFPKTKFKTNDWQTAKAKPKAGGEHCVVLNTGAVLVGELVHTKKGLTVTQADGVKTRVPNSAIRWSGPGAQPAADYWTSFAGLPIDSRFRRPASLSAGPSKNRRKASNEAYGEASKRNPKVSMAILAQGRSDWGPATGLWLQVYKSEGFKRTYFENVKHCSHKWIDLNLDPFRREALEKCVDTLLEITKAHGVFDRPEVKALLAQRLKEAAEATYVAGFPKTSQGLVARIASLGGDYAEEATIIWKQITSK